MCVNTAEQNTKQANIKADDIEGSANSTTLILLGGLKK